MTRLIGVDWGVESLRAWRLDARGTVVDRRESVDGLRRAARRGYEKTLLRHVGGWLEPDATVVIASAVVDRRGWIETPFLAAPADLDALLDDAVPGRLGDATLLALPGIASRAAGAEDVMRREALLALGAASGNGGGQRLLVVPGARSRWIRTADGRVEAFRTSIGGELLARLLGGAFGRVMPVDETGAERGFLDGVERGYRSRHFVTDLFAARAGALLDEHEPGLARARLAGLVLGNEIREAEIALEATGEALTLIGDDETCAPYARALRHLGTTVGHDGADTAAVAGFDAIRTALSDGSRPRTARDPMATAADATPGAAVAGPSARVLPAAERTPPAPPRRGWDDAFAALPLLGFLPVRDPDRLVAAATLLVEAGFRTLVVSMRAAHAPTTIRRLSAAFGARVCIGVRDVPSPKAATAAIDAGARVVIATGTDEALARRCAKRGVPWVPGVATVTEANRALALGARALLLYPAELIEPRAVRAMRRALPSGTPLVPAGGLDARALLPYAAAGASGAVADETLLHTIPNRADRVAAARAFVATWCRVERGRRALESDRRASRPPPERADDAPATPSDDTSSVDSSGDTTAESTEPVGPSPDDTSDPSNREGQGA